jgi:hypothetical protein
VSIIVSLNTVSTTVYFYTVVQDQCTIVALFYCITSLPVYPNAVHGHCTTVVLETSNSVCCIATLMEYYSVLQQPSKGGLEQFSSIVLMKRSYIVLSICSGQHSDELFA